MKRGLAIGLALLATSPYVFSPSANARIRGSFKSSTDFYQQKLGQPTDDLTPFLLLDVGGKNKITKKFRFQWRLFAAGNMEAEGEGATEGTPFNEAGYVDLPEAFFELKAGSSKFKLGMNTINWGVVDGYSPSSVVNTSAFFHPLRTYKRGAPMIEWQLGGDKFGFEALYIPRQPRSVLPATDSRWLPRDILVNLSSLIPQVTFPDRIEYTYGPEIEASGAGVKARDHNAGARLYAHLGKVDLQLTHFEGLSAAPKVKVLGTINSTADGFVGTNPMELRPVSYRIRNTGAGITYAGDSVIFRLESAYQDTLTSMKDNLGLQPWSWTSAAGMETNLNIGSTTMTAILQYYQTENPQKADNLISSSYRLFDQTGVLALRWPFNDDLVMSGSVLYEMVNKGLFWTAGFENKFADALKWGVSWRDFSAGEEGLIRTFEKNDHFALDLSYYF